MTSSSTSSLSLLVETHYQRVSEDFVRALEDELFGRGSTPREMTARERVTARRNNDRRRHEYAAFLLDLKAARLPENARRRKAVRTAAWHRQEAEKLK